MTDRIAVLGDLSGWASPTVEVLTDLGVSLSVAGGFVHGVETWPDDLWVVQVGDVVHKGPESLQGLALVCAALETGRWVQLCGNHESQYVGAHDFWQPQLEQSVQHLLRQLFNGRDMRVAVALDTVELGPTVVTHAGVSPARHDQALRRAERELEERSGLPHVDTVRWLNRAATGDGRAFAAAFTPGVMAGFDSAEPGVAWAEARREVLLPWMRRHDRADGLALSYSQVHGHSSPLWVGRDRSWRVASDLSEVCERERGTGHTRAQLETSDGQVRSVVGVDPGANGKRKVAPRPLLLSGTVLA